MTKLPALALGLLLFASLTVPLAAAHGAPAAPDHYTRILHDHNDDSLFLIAQGISAFDSIALDATTAYNATAGEPELVLRMTLNGGCTECSDQTQTVQFTTPNGSVELDFVTDGEALTWTGDMDWYSQSTSVNDGTRFAVDGAIRFSALGIEPGTLLTDWFVQASTSAGSGDNMPYGLAGEPDLVPNLDGSLGLAYNIGTYTVPAPDFYLSIDGSPEAIELDGENVLALRSFNFTNDLKVNQAFTLGVTAPEGIHTSFDAVSFALEPGQTAMANLTIHNGASDDVEGSILITATTNWHGFGSFEIPVTAIVPSGWDGAGGIFDTGVITPGNQFAWRFTEAGHFAFADPDHPLLAGLIHVGGHDDHTGHDEHAGHAMDEMEDTNGMDHSQHMAEDFTTWTVRISSDDATLDPAELAIAVGDVVVFENTGTQDHRFVGVAAPTPTDNDSDSFLGIPNVGTMALLAVIGIAALISRRQVVG